MDIIQELFKLQDLKYKEFNSKLIPNIDADTMIGVRLPQIRSLAKNIKNSTEAKTFMNTLPHKYYEENNLHGFLVEGIKDYDKCIIELNKFLPYVDNWATCDTIRPKTFKNNSDKLLEEIKKWIKSEHTYTVRFGIGMLMTFYLDKNFDEKYLNMVAGVKSDEYYINMMIAWYFATALAKQYKSTIPYIAEKCLPVWIHNKTIQKAVESYRIDDETKKELKKLKIK